MKKTILVAMSLALTLSLSSSALASNSSQKSEIVFFDNEADRAVKKLKEKTTDEEATTLLKKFNPQTSYSDNTKQIAINYDEINSNPSFVKRATQHFNKGGTIYFYGSNLKLSDIESVLGVVIEKKPNPKANDKGETITTAEEETYQIIGISPKNLKKPYLRQIKNVIDGKTEPVSNLKKHKDIFVQEVMSIVNEDPFKSNEISVLDYQSDPIVASKYSITKTIYQGSDKVFYQNVFWILHQNTTSDTDHNYDYFYIEHSVETNFYNGARVLSTSSGGSGNTFDLVHTLPYSSDIQREYSPKSTSSSSVYTVALPWVVQWQFSLNASAALTSTGSQSTGIAKYSWTPTWAQSWLQFPETYKPGTAWASKGNSLASIDLQEYIVYTYNSKTYSDVSNQQVRHYY
ncbi:hypothetical protein GK047_17860 [Paenibacillus sp. SYP-B3998]|uniref:Uncharacterized protein n=1 Tax=Paenibacillus sp. SYP-B3998 TaxID=2678564 RepID=A0A6G4A214_9BACL|nr:hypothetical protein [Paenibacillus sp. SYP-B3998]NEW07869.1 hypothetical protein [Paenibacillus sp. SYP-B3998]